jgi:hypothetical protein
MLDDLMFDTVFAIGAALALVALDFWLLISGVEF